MYTLTDLVREIEQVIEQLERQGTRSLHPDWITQSVLYRHPAIEGGDADFYQCLTRSEVRNQVRQRLNRFKAKAEVEAERQLVLEGFERLQRRYLVNEDGEQVAVRVQDLTSAQRLAKADELDRMGDGCHQHASELRRFDAQASAA